MLVACRVVKTPTVGLWTSSSGCNDDGLCSSWFLKGTLPRQAVSPTLGVDPYTRTGPFDRGLVPELDSLVRYSTMSACRALRRPVVPTSSAVAHSQFSSNSAPNPVSIDSIRLCSVMVVRNRCRPSSSAIRRAPVWILSRAVLKMDAASCL